MSQDYLSFLYNRFPRQFSKPERVTVGNVEELRHLIGLYYKNAKCGVSIYDFTRDHPITPDRIVFDFDGPNCLEECRLLHKEFRAIRHFMVFSGKGFHFYLYTTNYGKIKDPKTTLQNVYRIVEKKWGVKNDPSIVANAPAHCLAVPGTFNYRRGRYTIFITEKDLDADYDAICEKAKTPHHPLKMYGDEYFDLGAFDSGAPKPAIPVMEPTLRADLPPIERWASLQPHFIQNMVLDPSKCTNKSRFYTMIWCRFQGYPKEYALNVAKHYYSRLAHDEGGTKWERFLRQCPLNRAYDGPIFRFPNKETLRKEGYL